ncbi:hypothetical protein FHG66_03490 [Rubellimicrobium rubrum]|uniref:Uncharacterized protein n=1 Tax=Rubellimicrobium rubrum TaxID=2585369 RepID=A0A5C4N4D9_9RHOB|nr:hypothetical protein [Rubellimicrobium rubrum]TNC51888.1 hypothetical protein FHG66_03490 [Rubellimicrobium rubrum]
MNKFVILVAAAMIGSATLVTAQETTATENAFGIIPVQDGNNLLIEIPLVTATTDGEVQIYSIVDERQGEPLGTGPVTAGANENVRITLTTRPIADAVLAVLVIDGQAVAQQEIELSPQGGESDNDDDSDNSGDNDSNDGEAGSGTNG